MKTIEEMKKVLTDRQSTVMKNLLIDSVAVNDKGSIEKSFVTLHISENKTVEKIVKGKKEKVDHIVVSIITMTGVLRPVVGSSVVHHIKDVPESLETILDGCTLGEVYQEHILNKGIDKDPITDKDRETGEDGCTYNHPFDVTLGDEGKSLVKQIKILRTLGAKVFGFGMK